MKHSKRIVIARLLRKRDTWAEKTVWRWLRNRRFSSYKFRRQHVLGRYTLDFFCLEARLNIELDGNHHGVAEHRAKDAERDAWLEGQGIKVLRFWNGQLLRERQFVRDIIWRTLQERAPHPLPDYCRPGLCLSSLASEKAATGVYAVQEQIDEKQEFHRARPRPSP